MFVWLFGRLTAHLFDCSLAMSPSSPNEPSGSWDSIHVFETAERGRTAHYKLTSTVMLHLITRRGSENDNKAPTEKNGPENLKREGEVSLSGSMTRQVCFFLSRASLKRLNSYNHPRQAEQDCPLTDASSHISNIGKMIEDMEIKMRNLLQEVRPFFPVASKCEQ